MISSDTTSNTYTIRKISDSKLKFVYYDIYITMLINSFIKYVIKLFITTKMFLSTNNVVCLVFIISLIGFDGC